MKAPFSYPKSSLSKRDSDRAAQLSAMKGPFARGESRWTVRASTSFPTPVSPRTSTEMDERAARAACSYTPRITGSTTTTSSPGSPADTGGAVCRTTTTAPPMTIASPTRRGLRSRESRRRFTVALGSPRPAAGRSCVPLAPPRSSTSGGGPP